MNVSHRHERRSRIRRVLYQKRCSTPRDLSNGEFAVIVLVVLALLVFLLLSTTLIGQQILRYLGKVFRLTP